MELQDAYLEFKKIQSILGSSQNLLAVSKKQPLQKIIELHNLGQTHFAENYVQEALDKIEKTKDLKIHWHLIGPLQKNKIKYIKNYFSYIHSVDSVDLAEKLNSYFSKMNIEQKIFLQINLSNEQTKSGFTEDELLIKWPELQKLNHLKIVGLMTMPPLQNNAEENRIYFKKCFDIGKKLGLHEFSMGTSHDYRVALEEGATWIRVGTLLFGERKSE